MLTIILDTSNVKSPLMIGKFEPSTDNFNTVMSLDLTTVCEATALLIKAISSQNGLGLDRDEILERVFSHIKESTYNVNVAQIVASSFEKNTELLGISFSQN